MRSPAAVIERADAAIFVAIENLVARLPRDAELGTQRRHLLALEQAGHKPEPLVHDVTLLPRHAPSCEGAKVSPMCPEYGVTYLSGRTSQEAQSKQVANRQAIQILSVLRIGSADHDASTSVF